MTDGPSTTLGDEAERYVVERVPCPSCGSALRQLPPGYPLFDVQCSGCLFRAQVKRVQEKPRSRLRGGSWNVVNTYLRTGQLLPPMFVCFDWPRSEAEPGYVYFFPLVPAKNVVKRVLSELHKTDAGRAMAEYRDMLSLPHQVIATRAPSGASVTPPR
jgi:hypothetical protein